jgi:hypothetical protein
VTVPDGDERAAEDVRGGRDADADERQDEVIPAQEEALRMTAGRDAGMRVGGLWAKGRARSSARAPRGRGLVGTAPAC